MNELIETMFYQFLTESEEVQELFETNDELDVEAMRTAFYAGYETALRVQRVKILCAMRQQKKMQGKA